MKLKAKLPKKESIRVQLFTAYFFINLHKKGNSVQMSLGSESLKQAGALGMPGASTKSSATIAPYPNFSASADAAALEKAIKDTDDATIIEILAKRSNDQRQQIKATFQQATGKPLEAALKHALHGHFEHAVLALLKTPTQFDAHELKRAMKGLGTDENCLIEILVSRSNKEINEIAKFYKEEFKIDLEKDIISDTSGNFQRALLALCRANRKENTDVNEDLADDDARSLYAAGEQRKGTDVPAFINILTSRSFTHLQKVFQTYHKYSSRDIIKVLDLELRGDIEDCLIAIVKCATNKPKFFADQLYQSMKGRGTRDGDLIRIMVSRSEIDMNDIKTEYKNSYGKSLYQAIMEETKGDYEKILLALCGSNS
ncbi:annexin A1-like [Latimeria chalumnae]|uniref:annexin A1-like n=1 Tax=Latimeria chalumnae TaxID=7897 RepID=UPI0003C162B1|nr:PREDICTED: annexin A1-like [Latimeria chalumnae]|eukprot:XP_006006356.1 PREDICTED: annexin A1-like [Latimeria chalumnae]